MAERFNSIEDFYDKHPNMKKPGIASSFADSQAEKKKEKKKKPIAKPPHIPNNAGFSFGRKLPDIDEYESSKNLLPSLLAEGDSIKIVLPYPPGTNNLFDTFINRKTGVPRRVPTKRYILWQQEARKILQRSKKMVLRGNLGIKMIFYRPQRSGDWDGFIKAPQDILKGHFFIDDKQIEDGRIIRRDDPANPRVEIEIWEIY